ncbi:gamma-interferon-inducible lysosomal thiol reductase [Elysia marginata]|uniref:Gamma-interferon-inducible lysosomal thiol reductase n=1 Tax=Elysia marginata TaxID=1093978 RepID=A0AAV4JEW2_9GAST|nr:gamma-interferon-inducible lysosomal thiol reductase [Elysia marginata]
MFQDYGFHLSVETIIILGRVCIIHYYPETTKQLEIIGCVEKDFYDTHGENWAATLKRCASTGVDVEKVSTCAMGSEGSRLQHQVALSTGPHDYVPWPLLDGVSSISVVI